MTATITSIPLNKLVVWKGNVRKTASAEGLQSLAASIASHGLLQTLVVREGKKGKFSVIAGARRLAALNLLADDGKLPADHPVPCQVVATGTDDAELSLAENAVREQMHPADEFDAFRDLVDKGEPIADIAARFGVTETVVQKRLKLARVSPAIIAAYRKDELTLQQVMAFTVSDDHAAQERVFENLSDRYSDYPDGIRAALTEDEISSDDRRVKFVTLKAYEKAGGTVRRDLFSTDESGFFIENPQLLSELLVAKLEKKAAKVAKEGWKWVEVREQFDYDEWSECERRYPEAHPLTPELEAEVAALTAEYEQLESVWQDDPDADAPYPERLTAIEDRLGEIDDREKHWTPETLAIAGAVVSLGHNGEADITRGFVLSADKPKARAKAASAADRMDDDGDDAAGTLPASLIETLTAHRSAALTAVLMNEPEIALAATAHAFASQVFYHTSRSDSCLQISLTTKSHRIADATAAQAVEQARIEWGDRIPCDSAELWAWCFKRTREELLSLIAFCIADSINCVVVKNQPSQERVAHANQLADAVNLDMRQWFAPDAENYFGRVNKNLILQALREAKGDIAPSWASMKKSELAALAAREIGPTAWLPAPLRSAEPEDAAPSEAA